MLKVRLQGLSPAAQVERQVENARLTKVLMICARPMAQSVEFTSLTGLPEGQRLSETLREADARATNSFVRDLHCDFFRDEILRKIENHEQKN